MDVKKKEKIIKQEKKFDYYKISTFVLLGIILIGILAYGFVSYSSYRFEQGVLFGQENTVNLILQNVNKNGYVNVFSGNTSYILVEQNVVVASLISSVINTGKVDLVTNEGNITLVPSVYMEQIKQNTILEILGIVRDKGFVSLYDNVSQVTLVPYVEPGKIQE
ncbi:MAG: hypothetical protein KC589_11035 [Nanoarchaeota archaeon]|nr:hypothetical protein [Nanoarchaeota archaeon]